MAGKGGRGWVSSMGRKSRRQVHGRKTLAHHRPNFCTQAPGRPRTSCPHFKMPARVSSAAVGRPPGSACMWLWGPGRERRRISCWQRGWRWGGLSPGLQGWAGPCLGATRVLAVFSSSSPFCFLLPGALMDSTCLCVCRQRSPASVSKAEGGAPGQQGATGAPTVCWVVALAHLGSRLHRAFALFVLLMGRL